MVNSATKHKRDEVQEPSDKKIKRNNQPSNSKFHSDALVLVCSFLETIDVVSASIVSKDWRDALNSDGIWFYRFRNDLGDPDYFLEKFNNQQITMNTLKKALGSENFWFNFFKLVVSMIPIQNVKTMMEKKILKNEINNCESNDPIYKQDNIYQLPDDEYYGDKLGWENMKKERYRQTISKNYCYFTLRLGEQMKQMQSSTHANDEDVKKLLESLKIDINVHILGVILSIFDRHGFVLNLFGSDPRLAEQLSLIRMNFFAILRK